MQEAWEGFEGGNWLNEIDVRDFIQKNYTPYEGDESFLVGPTERTVKLWDDVMSLLLKEREQGGVLDMDTKVVTGILSHKAGYIDAEHPERETIVGLQTDAPLKRALHVNGGIRIACQAAAQHGYEVDPEIVDFYTNKRKTHNAGVFDAYTPEMRACRSAHIITGLPDGYGRGRIIGDYRRVALYGVNRLIEEKQKDKDALGEVPTTEKEIRCAEELSDQIKALKDMIAMAASYGFDITRPAENAKEAVQWLYFGYLAGIKEQNGAAMSLGRTSTFLDIYFERDIKAGLMTESEAQEIMDDFVLHLRMARHLRTPEYNELFGGDPMWITEAVGGIGEDGRHMVTKNSYRMLNTLYNLNAAAEPNLTVLWSENLPENWKKFIAKVSIDTDALQYENDDVMRPYYGDDYAIACCVSAMRVGKDMQFFGARANIAKLMMMAINGGRDENKFEQVGPEMPVMEGDVLDYEEVLRRMDIYRPWLAKTYVSAMNTIHYMHDKYAYEKSQMALHDTEVRRLMAFGIAGMSCMADSLSAIKYAKVKPIRNPENGIIVDFEIEGDFPKYGNDDDRADDIAVELLRSFLEKIKRRHTYRNSEATTSILTITSNVVYGKATGAMPDGRKAYTPFAPGGNPSYGAETHGLLASLNSVAKLPYHWALDGISNTQTINPEALGHSEGERKENLVQVLDGYFDQGAHHLNVNVFGKEKLLDAMEHPEKEEYANFTIRVSGYAVKFIDLTREQQMDVISRTCHAAL